MLRRIAAVMRLPLVSAAPRRVGAELFGLRTLRRAQIPAGTEPYLEPPLMASPRDGRDQVFERP